MSKKVERTLTADLEARELAGGVWRLSGGGTGAVELILRGTDTGGRASLANLRASKAVIVWDGADAVVTLTTAAGPRRLRARTAILHEPKSTLYAALPLVHLAAAARRFWRRGVLLVRIPGGRRLLGLLARRAGGPRRRRSAV